MLSFGYGFDERVMSRLGASHSKIYTGFCLFLEIQRSIQLFDDRAKENQRFDVTMREETRLKLAAPFDWVYENYLYAFKISPFGEKFFSTYLFFGRDLRLPSGHLF